MWRRGKNEEQRLGGVCDELDLTEGWNQGVAEAPDYSIDTLTSLGGQALSPPKPLPGGWDF